MTADHETTVRVALDELVEALLMAIRAELEVLPPAPDRLLSIDDAAKALGIGRTALYGELMRGELRSMKVGRRRLIPLTAIRQYIASSSDSQAGAVSRKSQGSAPSRDRGTS
jgi:excisionase family DNA binding protein